MYLFITILSAAADKIVTVFVEAKPRPKSLEYVEVSPRHNFIYSRVENFRQSCKVAAAP
jgi:hypothetical protein